MANLHVYLQLLSQLHFPVVVVYRLFFRHFLPISGSCFLSVFLVSRIKSEKCLDTGSYNGIDLATSRCATFISASDGIPSLTVSAFHLVLLVFETK